MQNSCSYARVLSSLIRLSGLMHVHVDARHQQEHAHRDGEHVCNTRPVLSFRQNYVFSGNTSVARFKARVSGEAVVVAGREDGMGSSVRDVHGKEQTLHPIHSPVHHRILITNHATRRLTHVFISSRETW